MKDPSRPPSGRPPFQSEPDPTRDTPFEPYRYRVQTMPQGLRRELIGIELQSYCIFLRADDIDLSHTANHRDSLCQNGLGIFIDGR